MQTLHRGRQVADDQVADDPALTKLTPDGTELNSATAVALCIERRIAPKRATPTDVTEQGRARRDPFLITY
jgi:hypothetical protein